jgi:ketosteroid isomerase-like protein
MPQPASEGLPAREIAAIRQVSCEWLRCVLARDYERVAKWHTEDAVLMPPNHPAVHGRDAIRQWSRQYPRAMEFEFSIELIEGRADIAYVRGTYRMKFQPEGAPDPIEDAGKYVEIRKRQPDGSWLLAVVIFNADR